MNLKFYLALLKLARPVQYKEHIVPVCLPKFRENFEGRLGTVVGWGRTKYKYGENHWNFS